MNFSKRKSLAIIGTVGVPARYGGFETLAEQLVRNLDGEFDITVYCSKHNYKPEEQASHFENARLVWLPFKANGFWGLVYDAVSMVHALFFAEVLLVLGVPGAFMFPFLRLFTRKKIIVNIDGLEWARAKWGRFAKFYLRTSEWFAVRFAHEVVTDNAAIQKYALERYGCKSRLITYGGDQARSLPLNAEVEARFPWVARRYAFTVCRIEPENNIHTLLEAFSGIQKMPLVIVGNWDSGDYARELREKWGQHPNLHLLDPIYDLNILNRLRANCAVYMHGHSAGGTNPSLVEAMHLGVPICAFDVMFNRVTTGHKAFYFNDVCALQSLMEFADFEEFNAMASDMLMIARREYVWSKIARAYADLAYDAKPEPAPVFAFDLPPVMRRQLQLA